MTELVLYQFPREYKNFRIQQEGISYQEGGNKTKIYQELKGHLNTLLKRKKVVTLLSTLQNALVTFQTFQPHWQQQLQSGRCKTSLSIVPFAEGVNNLCAPSLKYKLNKTKNPQIKKVLSTNWELFDFMVDPICLVLGSKTGPKAIL